MHYNMYLCSRVCLRAWFVPRVDARADARTPVRVHAPVRTRTSLCARVHVDVDARRCAHRPVRLRVPLAFTRRCGHTQVDNKNRIRTLSKREARLQTRVHSLGLAATHVDAAHCAGCRIDFHQFAQGLKLACGDHFEESGAAHAGHH
eukprot:1317839-Pleurochrysis_carterae.AAC.1